MTQHNTFSDDRLGGLFDDHGPAGAVAVAVADLVRSSDPVVTFSSLADKLAALGYGCVLEILVNGLPAQRINRPAPAQEVASWAELALLLDSEPTVLSNGDAVGVSFAGPSQPSLRSDDGPSTLDPAGLAAPEPGFAGALVVRRLGDTQVTSSDAETVHALVDHAVAVVAAERLYAYIERQQARVEQLEQALRANREIGVAIGMLMARRRCSAEDALTLLHAAAGDGPDLREVAVRLAAAGNLRSSARPSPLPG